MIAVDASWPLLAAVPLIALTILWGLRVTRLFPPLRRAAVMTLRSLAIFALAGAVCLPHTRAPVPARTQTVYLVDVSDSVPNALILQAIGQIDADPGPFAVVAFGGESAVVAPMGTLALDEDQRRKLLFRRSLEELESLAEWRDRVDPTASRPARALDSAALLFRSATDRRVVLFTDGHVSRFSSNEPLTRLKVVPLRDPRPEVAALRLEGPPSIRPGEPFDLRLEILSRGAATARLQMTIDDALQPDPEREVQLVEGRQILRIRNVTLPASQRGGLVGLGVHLQFEGDAEPRNNSAFFHTRLIGRPRVLVLRPAGERDDPLITLLESLEMDVTAQRAASLPDLAASLVSYDSVIVLGRPEAEVPDAGWQALRRYLEGGGGLFCIANASLATQAAPEPLAALLPVTLQQEPKTPGPKPQGGRKPVTKQVRAPVVAVLLLIDKSGSMAGRNIALAKEACLASARTLSPKDIIGVIAFDAKAYWVVPPISPDRTATIESQILRLHASGGTNIHAGLLAAQEAFSNIDAAVKHAVIFSDGQTSPADFKTVVDDLVRDGVTLSTVTLMQGQFDTGLMLRLAKSGGGRPLLAPDANRLPQIFTNEVKQVIRTVKRPGTPTRPPPETPEKTPDESGEGGPGFKSVKLRVRAPHQILQGIELDKAPALTGRVKAKEKELALVPIEEAEGRQPMLALGRVGLGKVAVWCSDLGGEWTRDYFRWKGSTQMVAQTLRHISSTLRSSRLADRVHIRQEGQRAVVLCDLPPEAEVTASLTHPETRALPLSIDASGLRRGEFHLGKIGESYQVTLRSQEETAVVAATAAYADELAPPQAPQSFFDEIRRAGAEVTDVPRWPDPDPVQERKELAPWLALAALVLLLADLAVRRF